MESERIWKKMNEFEGKWKKENIKKKDFQKYKRVKSKIRK